MESNQYVLNSHYGPYRRGDIFDTPLIRQTSRRKEIKLSHNGQLFWIPKSLLNPYPQNKETLNMSKRTSNKKGGLRKGVANTHNTKVRGGTPLRKPTHLEMIRAKLKAALLAEKNSVVLPPSPYSNEFADKNGVYI